MMQMNS